MLVSEKVERSREQTVGHDTSSESGHQLEALGTHTLDQLWPRAQLSGLAPQMMGLPLAMTQFCRSLGKKMG